MTNDSQLAIPDRASPATDDHPVHDPEFTLEAQESRDHILKWWDIVTTIEDSPRVRQACRAATIISGLSWRRTENIYQAWKRNGRDWRILANRSKWPDPADSNLPGSFIFWVKERDESHQRGTAFEQTHREILAQLDLWEADPHNPDLAIPGYDRPPKRNPFTGIPYGWSCDNLRRRARSNAYEKAVRRQGPKRASEFLPSVRTSRVGLEYGELVYFDDQEHDTMVNLTGRNEKAVRAQSFNALEALSGSCVEVGVKPLLEDGDTLRELNQLDFFWFAMLYLTKHGWNPKTGTTLIVEWGKTNPDKREKSKTPDHFDIMIEKVTGGAVRMDRSGIFRAAEFKAMLLEGKPSGNFRFKAPIESFFNLVRNYSDALPAPTGRNRDEAPEESHGLVLYNNQLQKLIDKLPLQHFLSLRRPVLEWEDYRRLHFLIMDAIDKRRDHNLEGYRKLGFTGARYRLGHDKPWIDELDYQAIPLAERRMYDHVVSRQGNNETFLLSPYEVRCLLSSQLKKMPMRMIPLLAPPRAWEDVVVSQSLEIEIKDQWLDSEPLYFIGKVTTPQGYEVNLQRGKRYKRLLNLFDPSTLWIAEAEGSKKGAFIGTAARVHVSCKTDYESILTQLGDKHHVRMVESAEVRARMQSEAAKRVADRKFNRSITHGESNPTPEQKQEARDEARKDAARARFGQRCKQISNERADEEAAPVVEQTSPEPPIEEVW